MVRRSSKSAGSSSGKKTPAKKSTGRGRLRGAAGREQLDSELERQKAREEQRKKEGSKPFTFWMPDGDTREVIILDDEPYFFRYEHNLQDPRTGKYGLVIECSRSDDNCPICLETGKDGTYVMYLTVIDLNEFTDRSGNVHEFSRKLFPVKQGQQKKFIRRFDKDGTLRGAVYELSRDGAKSPVIGNDIEFIEFVSDDELADYVRTYKDKDGKTQTEDCSVVFDYDEFMPEMDASEIADEYEEAFGKRPKSAPGSAADNDDDNYDDEEEEEEARPNRRKSRGAKPARKRQEEDELDEDEDEEDGDEPPFDTDDEVEEEKPARKTRGRRKKADDDDDEEEEAPKRRPARRTANGGSSRPRRPARRSGK